MIGLSFNVRISWKEGFTRTLSIPDIFTPFLESTKEPILRQFRRSEAEDFASPVIEYGLSLEGLNESVVTPFKRSRDLTLGGRTIPIAGVERIEIRAQGTDQTLPNSPTGIAALLRQFERSGADVTREFIQDSLPAWGPKVGTPERPESIPVDQLYDRLVTNELLREATRNRFRSRNLTDAVEAAFKCLVNAVKERSGCHDRDGADLMRHVFGEQSPLLKLNSLQSQSEKNEHNGYREIFAGAITGIRNPRAHEPAIRDDPAVALELLALANHLMRRLDRATRNASQSEDSTP